MNTGSNKDYTLLLQDDSSHYPDMNERGGASTPYSEMEEEEDESIIIEEEDSLYESNDSEDSDGSYIQINKHRTLSNESLLSRNGNGNGRYKQLGSLRKDTQNHCEEAHSTAIWTPTPMSPARRAGFLASIMFGILMGALFLWALPCNVQDCSCSEKRPSRWKTELESVVVNYKKIIQLEYGAPYLLVGYQNGMIIDETFPLAMNDTEEFNQTQNSCGLLLLSGSTGQEIWNAKLGLCPTDIICSHVDITGDGFHECLVMGENSPPVMLDPSHGTILWAVRDPFSSQNNFMSSNYSEPIFLEDLDGDNHKELLFSFSISFSDSESPNMLLIVSGRNGLPIGQTMKMTGCYGSTRLNVRDTALNYVCFTEDSLYNEGSIPIDVISSELLSGLESSYNTTLELQPISDPFIEKDFTDSCSFGFQNIGNCPSCKTVLQYSTEDSETIENSQVVSSEDVNFSSFCDGVIVKLWKYSDVKKYPVNNETVISTNKTYSSNMIEYHIEETVDYIQFSNSTSSPERSVLETSIVHQTCNTNCFPSSQMEVNSIVISYASVEENFLVAYVSSTSVRKSSEEGLTIGTPVSVIKKVVHHLHSPRPWLRD